MSQTLVRASAEIPATFENAADAVIRVGEGRGFVVQGEDECQTAPKIDP